MDRFRPVADGAPSEEGAPEALDQHQPDLAAPDLGELLKACGRGDESAFARLYDATSTRVVGLALRVVRDRAQAAQNDSCSLALGEVHQQGIEFDYVDVGCQAGNLAADHFKPLGNRKHRFLGRIGGDTDD